jgi:hypothetical protein
MHTPSTSNVGHTLAGTSIETTIIPDALDVYQPVATVAGVSEEMMGESRGGAQSTGVSSPSDEDVRVFVPFQS